MQFNLNESNISEDWGWFVDTETLLLIDQANKKYNNKLKINNINLLEKIIEKDEKHYDDDIENLKKTETIIITITALSYLILIFI